MLSDLMQHIDTHISDVHYYSIFGESIKTNSFLGNLPTKDSDSPTLKFTEIYNKNYHLKPANYDPLYVFSGSYNIAKGINKPLYIYRYRDGCLVRLCNLADFHIYDRDILLLQIDESNRNLTNIFFSGMIISLWLELHGMPALHASAVEINGKATAFLSLCQSGKSTLAAGFMQSGYALMTDDVLPIERRNGKLLGRPGYPQMKMWPEAALNILGHYHDLSLVDPKDPGYNKVKVPVGPNGFGTFCSQPRSLAAIYMPFRQQNKDCKIKIEPVSPAEAIIELIRYSFIANIVERLGLQAERFRFFAALVRDVPVRKISYPSGYQNLSKVKNAIIDDLRNTC